MSRDRGYGTGPWLWHLSRSQIRFVVRWKKGNKLLDAAGQERKAWEIARGKRRWGEAQLRMSTPIFGSIAARGGSPCPSSTQSIQGSGLAGGRAARQRSRAVV